MQHARAHRERTPHPTPVHRPPPALDTGAPALHQGAPNLAFFGKGVSAARKVFAVIDRKPKIDIEQEGKVLPAVEGAIELQNITFAYPARPDVTIFT
jgi:ATP-binding cassette, subfamily B (MDR/TAP), member 1